MSFEQRPKCKICGALHFARDPHQFGADAPKASTAARMDVPFEAMYVPSPNSTPVGGKTSREAGPKLGAGTQAPPVDTTPKRGRPATGFDRKEYQKIKARERRAKAKGSKP